MSSMPEIKTSVTTGRPPIAYSPSIWGHHFLSHTCNGAYVGKPDEAFEEMKEEARKMLIEAETKYNEKPLEMLELIDTMEGLGVAYYFKPEIERILHMVYDQYTNKETYRVNDLDRDALTFRLLRQHGYAISSDLFLNFKDCKTNMFMDCLTKNPKGLLNLYEASHFSLHGETILDEAQLFSAANLKSLVSDNNSIEPVLACKIRHALNRPILKEPARLRTRHFLDMYKLDVTHNENLLKFARMDFQGLQELYQAELRSLTQWWKDAEYTKTFHFTRDRVVEFFFWAMAIYWEREYSFARCSLAKLICILTIVDDIYDVYATLEEVELFTNAIQRWDMNCIDELPEEYLKEGYKATLGFFKDFEEKVEKQGRPTRNVQYAIEEMKKANMAILQEFKICKEKDTQTVEDYLSIGLVSTCQGLFAALTFAAMEDLYVAEHVYQWISSMPVAVMAVNSIGRVLNDIASHHVEEKNTSVECYMMEYGVTIEEARIALKEIVTSNWKDLNEACLNPGGIPQVLMFRLLNKAQILDVLYKDGDYITFPEGLQSIIKYVIMDSVWDD